MTRLSIQIDQDQHKDVQTQNCSRRINVHGKPDSRRGLSEDKIGLTSKMQHYTNNQINQNLPPDFQLPSFKKH